ncbi:MAG: lysophospholipid acyltransferase family protein [Candidatus Nanopelagicales bacterium]
MAAAAARGGVDAPSWTAAANARNLASAALRMTYRVNAHGAHHVGRSGPLVIVTSCEALLAGAVVHATAPRPVHVIANEAMARALPARALAAAGDLRAAGAGSILAQHQALAALRDERAVVVAGDAVPASYLVAMSGAAVLPVVVIGAMGRVPTDPPRPRSRIDVFYHPPVVLDVPGDPLRASTRAAVAEQLRQLLADAGEQASRRLVPA